MSIEEREINRLDARRDLDIGDIVGESFRLFPELVDRVSKTVESEIPLRELVDLVISPEVSSADEVEMLQDLVLAAANEALRKAREAVEEEMRKATGGLGLPGMM